ncbi:MAG: alkaline phosphatase D family protein, partial [Pseudomonadota bacterium]
TDKRGPVGWEVATPSVSSPGFEGYLPIAPETVEAGLKDASPDVKYMNAKDRGYVTIRLTREEAIARYHYVSTVKSRDFDAKDGPVFRVVPGGAPDETTLEPVV